MSTTGSTNEAILYHYDPSLPLAAAFCAAFALSTLVHTYQMFVTKSWYMTAILVGGLCETVGYIGRAVNSGQEPNYALAPYIIQALLLLVAPLLIAASVYMIMGYIIRATDGDQYSIIQDRTLTAIFVLGDMTSFSVQGTGAGLLTKVEQKSKDVGNWIIIGGLAIQFTFFGLFMVCAVVFWIRLAADKARSTQLKEAKVPWRLHLAVLVIASVLIMVRSVFRVVEYIQGRNGYILMHEMYLYIFDAALMLGAMVVLNVIHPTQITGLVSKGKAIQAVFKCQNVGAFAVEEKAGEYPHRGSLNRNGR